MRDRSEALPGFFMRWVKSYPRGMKNAAWLVTWGLCAGLICTTDYRAHDPDAHLYAAMSEDLARRPVAQWCAPAWNDHWERQGLFFEHPPGLFWMGALLVRLGMAGLFAVYLINLTAFFISLWLLKRIAQVQGGPLLAAGAVGLWVLTPAFIRYTVQGSLEHPLTCAVLLGLYALVVARSFWGRTGLWGLAVGCAVFLKGVAGLALIPIGAWYALVQDRRPASAAVQVGMGTSMALASAVGFEGWYQTATGVGFWGNYGKVQVLYSIGQGFSIPDKLSNFFYYMAGALWFALPMIWLVLAGVYFVRRPGPVPWRNATWQIGMLVTATFIMGFALANRRSTRYIFPAYPALALTAAWSLLHMQGPMVKIRTFLEKHVHALPYALMGGLVCGVGLKIYVANHHYHFIRWWG